MEIKSVQLKNFRNYTNEVVFFNKNLNVLEGKNAQGKTNLLEAVFLCAIGKSPRTNKEKELIKWNENLGKVTIEFNKISGNKKIEIYLFSNQNKAVKINGVPIKKLGELMGELNAIYFSPDELKLVKDYEKPVLGDNEVLIKTIMAGICNTDYEITKGYMGYKGVLGHEFVGIVVAIGDKVPKNIVGKRVVGEINCACENCSWCHRGLQRHCPNRSTLGIYKKDGCFSEYFTLPYKNVFEISDNIDDITATFTEPLAAAYEILEQVHIKPDSKVAILGDGKLGLCISLVFRALNIDFVHIGKHENKLKISRDIGAKTMLLSELTQKQIKSFDVVVEATGSTGGFETYQGWNNLELTGNGSWQTGRPSAWGDATVTYGTGYFQATLTWVNSTGSIVDYDLHLTGPNSTHIYFGSKNNSYFELDRDWTSPLGNAIENIYSINETMPAGTYTVYVNLFSGVKNKPFNCRIILNGTVVKSVSSSISSGNQTIYTFTIE